MDTNGQSHQIGDEHQPTVRMGFVGIVLPFQDEPEYQCCEEAGEGIHFTLHSREPERVAPCVDERTGYATANHSEQLPHRRLLVILHQEFLSQMRHAPEQEQDTSGTEQGTHDIDHLCHLRRIAGKERKEIAHQHEERCARGVSHFQFVSGGDELRAVPETCRGFNCGAVGECRNGEHHPTDHVVDDIVLFHIWTFIMKFAQHMGWLLNSFQFNRENQG